MSSYVLSVDAEFDLDDIWEYIASDNIDAADRWIEKLFDAIESLGQTPGMEHRREDLFTFRHSIALASLIGGSTLLYSWMGV